MGSPRGVCLAAGCDHVLRGADFIVREWEDRSGVAKVCRKVPNGPVTEKSRVSSWVGWFQSPTTFDSL
jgi:hypothetical protein